MESVDRMMLWLDLIQNCSYEIAKVVSTSGAQLIDCLVSSFPFNDSNVTSVRLLLIAQWSLHLSVQRNDYCPNYFLAQGRRTRSAGLLEAA